MHARTAGSGNELRALALTIETRTQSLRTRCPRTLPLVLVVDARLGPRQNLLLAVKAFNKALDPGAL